MLGVVFIDSFAESWRCTQAQPITAFCPCCLASTGTGCMRRPQSPPQALPPLTNRKGAQASRRPTPTPVVLAHTRVAS